MKSVADMERKRLTGALEFCRDLASEELPHCKVGTGAEIALRHILRKCEEALDCGDEDGPGAEDGPWAAGWPERAGIKPEAQTLLMSTVEDPASFSPSPDSGAIERLENEGGPA